MSTSPISPPPIRLIAGLWLGSVLVLGLAWFYPALRHRLDARAVVDRLDCDLSTTLCTLSVHQEDVRVRAETSRSQWSTQTDFVILASRPPSTVTMYGEDMNMGIYTSSVSSTGLGEHRSTLDIPVCSRTEMVWRVELSWPDARAWLRFSAPKTTPTR